jgi:Mg-chelatase subunit ChlD
MADENQPPIADRDVVRDEVWYDREPAWKRLIRDLPQRRIALVGMIIALLLFSAFFTWYILRRSNPTPLIVVETDPYQWPYPPHAWIAEDIARLSALDTTSVRLMRGVRIGSSPNGPALTGIEELDRDALRRQKSIIIFISMCGASHNGIPFLVPPGASPTDPQEWLPIENVLAAFQKRLGQEFHDKPKLLVLDCSRVPVNWYLGWLNNNFVGDLQQWWNATTDGQDIHERFSTFAILTSSSPAQRSWASADLRGSVFAHFFCRGLAGEANASGVGNKISLKELFDYLGSNVDRWALENRADRQSPSLIPADAFDEFPQLVEATDESAELKDIEDGLSNQNSNVTDGERMKLWGDLAPIRQMQLYRFGPLTWRNIEHTLLHLDLLADAGAGYADLARSRLKAAQDSLKAMRGKLEQARDERSLFAYMRILFNDKDPNNDQLKVPSLALASYLGMDNLAAAQNYIERFAAAPQQEHLMPLRRHLEKDGLNNFAEAQFVQMLQRYQSSRLWENSELLSRLLQLRSPASDVGVPAFSHGFVGDERVHYAVRELAKNADNARRAAEDQLFVQGQAELPNQLQAAENLHAEAADTMDALQDAMRVRDRFWAEIAYQLQWESDCLRSDVPSEQELDPNEANLNEPLKSARALEEALSSGLPPSQTGADDAAAQVSKSLDRFMARLEAECNDVKGIHTAAAIRHMEAALANPLLPFDQRKELLAKYRYEVKNFNKRFKSSRELAVPADAKPSIYTTKTTSAEEHPLLKLVGSASAAPAAAATNDEGLNSRWLAAIQALESDLLAAKQREVAARGEWSALDQRLRAVTPICYVDQDRISEADFERPVRELRYLDLRSLVLWHAQRALDDFWGPGGDATPYFAAAANQYLDAASLLDRQARPTTNEQGQPPESTDIATLRQQVDQAAKTALNWLAVDATDSVIIERNEPAKTVVSVSTTGTAVPVKSGTAAVFLRENGERVDEVQFEPTAAVPLPIRQQELEATIRGGEPPAENNTDAMIMFRGHEAASPFTIEPIAGVTVNIDPHPFKPGRVTLRSPWKGVEVVLVLDCSQSMEQPLEAGRSRLAIAKDALAELLSRIGAREDYRVGVHLFGHRVGWSIDRPVRILTSPTYTGEVPADLTPERDVERVLPLGEANFDAAQQVFAALNSVEQGWGQSPLYYALSQALREDFANPTAEADNHIIVITDGQNYQARPTISDQAGFADVVQLAQIRQVPIHVLALAPNAEIDPVPAETAQLASQTGGTYQPLSSSLDLRQTLESLVRHDEYQLADADGRVVDFGQLGVRLSDSTQRTPGWYTVRYETSREDLRLDGGEAIELYRHAGETQLHAFPYSQDKLAETRLTQSGEPLDFVQRVHRPLRREHGVEFFISLQKNASSSTGVLADLWRWTPRPAEVWFEITPLISNGQAVGQAFPFYDANFEPDQPVPVFKVAASGWPASATAAAISAWYQPRAIQPSREISIASVIDAGENATAPIVRDLPGGGRMRVQAGFVGANRTIYGVRVIEQHFSPSTTVEWLKVSPPMAGDLLPMRVTRQFDHRHRTAVHRFYYRITNDRALQQLRTAAIAVTTREQCLADSHHADAVTVSISEAADLLPLAVGSVQPAQLSTPNAAESPQ